MKIKLENIVNIQPKFVILNRRGGYIFNIESGKNASSLPLIDIITRYKKILIYNNYEEVKKVVDELNKNWYKVYQINDFYFIENYNTIKNQYENKDRI